MRPRGSVPVAMDFPVVGIGASAGGLDACKRLLDALPETSGMAFILVQHLDPTHESMMVDLLTPHTKLQVWQATDGMLIEREHLYLIPPGRYLHVEQGALRLSEPVARHGARLPFDFLLHSLAEACGANAICVVLSGAGSDGSVGLRAVQQAGGLVIAQDPDEADYDGMPRSAIATGAVARVLTLAAIPAALAHRAQRPAPRPPPPQPRSGSDAFTEIIQLIRANTPHDFTAYKAGTLQRRIERRRAAAGVGTDALYLEMLRGDHGELERLASDLLIHVTRFFRDSQPFDLLASRVIPDLVGSHPVDRPLRIWIVGCSTGEETYSLAMLFHEAITAGKRRLKLQVFASDVDPQAIATAREGLYPESIERDISPARLSKFFSKQDEAYQVSAELRASVIFTIQDVLTDPPFSRLDFISCRNLLIYLGIGAQAKVVSLLHFALRQGGVLLLGASEIVSAVDGRFEEISRPERIYRRAGRRRLAEPVALPDLGESFKGAPRRIQAPSREATLATLCQRMVLESYAPAAVLINRDHDCLFSLGPTDRYLRVAPGSPSHDLLAMAREGLRFRLRSVIEQALKDKAPASAPGGRAGQGDDARAFDILVRPVLGDEEDLLLVCFVDQPGREPGHEGAAVSADTAGGDPPIATLQQELEATRLELQGAIRSLDALGAAHKAATEEALSINEEYQSTNEELLTSKEELQSLNEELTALNAQLQETLERQRTTSADLQNVLYSTDIATLFLDGDLKIRFFTPATKSIFNVIPGDVGRPLADLTSLASDAALLADARSVLHDHAPLEREVEAQGGRWFNRRVSAYRADKDDGGGVVMTFTDITERKYATSALEATKRQADLANAAKSRFLAAASHDLRQPLQTLALLQGLLAKVVEDEPAQKLVARLDETLGSMSNMLNTLLDINQIEAGTVQAKPVDFAVDEIFDRLREQFTYHAEAAHLQFRVVPCGVSVHTDPRLLEQMIRNLLSNAFKYTRSGRVLLGCRRRTGLLRIEVWDTGVGIPAEEHRAIFEAYHQLDNSARARSLGLGLGLSIVERLGDLLGHRVHVRSQPGRGSVFAIDLQPAAHGFRETQSLAGRASTPIGDAVHGAGDILVVEDDPDLRELLALMLTEEGHGASTASHASTALQMVASGTMRPDLILADYNLPGGMNGLEFADELRRRMGRRVPVVVLTGDISATTLREIAKHDCVQLNKPVKLQELTAVIQRLLAAPQQRSPALAARTPRPTTGPGTALVIVVDDDPDLRSTVREVLQQEDFEVIDYPSCEAFLEGYSDGPETCLLVDAYLPGMSGLQLIQTLSDAGRRLPAIMITGQSDVSMAVQAMKAGASDFIEKPFRSGELLASIERALEQGRDSSKLHAWRKAASHVLESLTARQRQIMELILKGHPSKNIAVDLGISQRTVENHRALIMKKTGSASLPALARLSLAAIGDDADPRVQAEPPPGSRQPARARSADARESSRSDTR